MHLVPAQGLQCLPDRIITEPGIAGNGEPIFRTVCGRELRDIRRQWHNALHRAG